MFRHERPLRDVMECHVPSWVRSPPRPFARHCSLLAGLRSPPPRHRRSAPLARIMRARLHVRAPARGGGTLRKCHEMSCSPCLRRCSAVPFLHIAPPLRFVPTRSVRSAAARPPGAAGPWFRAYRLCARARAGARPAPARFARLIARARDAGPGRTSPAPPERGRKSREPRAPPGSRCCARHGT